VYFRTVSPQRAAARICRATGHAAAPPPCPDQRARQSAGPPRCRACRPGLPGLRARTLHQARGTAATRGPRHYLAALPWLASPGRCAPPITDSQRQGTRRLGFCTNPRHRPDQFDSARQVTTPAPPLPCRLAFGALSGGVRLARIAGERRPEHLLRCTCTTDRDARNQILSSGDCVIQGVESMLGRVEIATDAGDWLIADDRLS